MTAFTVAVLSVFAVYGVITAVKEICVGLLANAEKDDKIIICVKSNAERAEGAVRSLMLKNPTAEIILIPEGDNRDIDVIAAELCRNYAAVRIVDGGNERT